MLFLFTRTLLIYLVISWAVRFMGKRQLGELSPTELITTVMISNLASICIEEPTLPVFYSLIPVLLITALELLNSALAFRIPAYGRFLSGKPIPVIHDGKIDQDNLREMRLSISDLLKALRGQGVFSPSEAALAIVETDGNLQCAACKHLHIQSRSEYEQNHSQKQKYSTINAFHRPSPLDFFMGITCRSVPFPSTSKISEPCA